MSDYIIIGIRRDNSQLEVVRDTSFSVGEQTEFLTTLENENDEFSEMRMVNWNEYIRRKDFVTKSKKKKKNHELD